MRLFDPWERLGGVLTYVYAAMLIALLLGLASHVPLSAWWESPRRAELLQAVVLTLATSLASTVLALVIALPVAWRLVRQPLRGQGVIDVLIDLPLSLSPLVMGMAFLLFFSTAPGRLIESAFTACGLPLRGAPTGVVLGQTVIATAFAIRHLRAAFASVATSSLTLPAAVRHRRTAVSVAATITWARTVGEFGPLLLFVGIIPLQSEVLSTAVYLSWISGDLDGAVLASLTMILLSFGVVLIARTLGSEKTGRAPRG